MQLSDDWHVPSAVQPRFEDYSFDLTASLKAVVSLRATIPSAAFTAETLGTERLGNGVVIRKDGLILTIGYLITEAEEIWLSLSNGRTVPGHMVGFDQATGFALVQALEKLDLPILPLGQSSQVELGDRVVIGGAGGVERSLAAHIVGIHEFAGYWEYVLDQAFFTNPAHPHWGGTAMIGNQGELLGLGSLQLDGEHETKPEPLNMIIPIDLLKPILDDMLTLGKPDRAPRPWLGFFASQLDDRIVIMGTSTGSPAHRAELQAGDLVLAVSGTEVNDLANFFRKIWSLGDAGVEVPLKIWRDGDTFDMIINSGDRAKFLKGPKLH
jgi:S1-C subfamily serine protease